MSIFIRSGIIAGVSSSLTFLIIHNIMISNIWFSTPFVLLAGALCGGILSGGYPHMSNHVPQKIGYISTYYTWAYSHCWH